MHKFVLPTMAAADVGLPATFVNVSHGWVIAALALAGVAIAVAGALLSAGRAADVHTASPLHTG